MAGIGRARQPRRVKPFHRRYGTLAFLVLILLVSVWAWMHDSGDSRAIAQMASTAFQWVRDDRIDLSLLSAASSSDGGPRLLDSATVSAGSRPEATSPLASPEQDSVRKAILAKMHADVTAQGGQWTAEAKVLAFGGVRARVAGPAGVTAEAVMGNVYFVAGNRVFALELSGDRIGDAFIPTELWQCVPLDIAPSDTDALEKHAQDCYETFINEPAAPGQESEILKPEPVFITF